MPSQLIHLVAADPPRRDDGDEVQEAKAVVVAADFCQRLQRRGERVTFGGLLAGGSGGAA